MQSTKRVLSGEGIFPARETHSVNIQHIITECILYPGLKNFTDHGAKDKKTNHLDSVMSSDDCNMAIKAVSLEEEAHGLQALKVWGASEGIRTDCTWISLYQPYPLEGG